LWVGVVKQWWLSDQGSVLSPLVPTKVGTQGWR
jgi:hypothetical protein